MISTSGRKILMQFVSNVKTLLTNNITSSLQQHYGIWADGRVIPVGPTDHRGCRHYLSCPYASRPFTVHQK